jgi:tRNA1(Val) A37 N6-methylase TrmN6
MAAWAVRTGDRVLEPSAGEGALVRAIWGRKADHITAVEIDEDRCDKLADLIDSCRGDGKRAFTSKILRVDFLNLVPDVVCAAADFDSVVMNPPFSRAAEARHVLHAMKFLKSGGRLAAIMSGGIRYRQDKVYQQLRDALGAQTMDALEDLPEDTFKSAGTCVSTVIVQWVKP